MRRTISAFLTSCTAALLCNVTSAAEFEIVTGSRRDICKKAYDAIESRTGFVWQSANVIAPRILWQEINYTIRDSSNPSGIRHLAVADVDVDNDGSKELLSTDTTLWRSQSVTSLSVIESGPLPPNGGQIDAAEEMQRESVELVFPFESKGFYRGDIRPMSYEDRNYILLMDSGFGRNVGISALIVEIRAPDQKARGYSPRMRWHSLDLRVVCEISTTAVAHEYLEDDP